MSTRRAFATNVKLPSDMDLHIACTLSTAELQERKATIFASLRNAVLGKSRITGGYRYEFANHSTTLRDVCRMVELERQCCRFLNFDLTESEKPIRLDVSGQPEALAIVEDLFG
jgi:hypothetical protein